MGQPDCSQNCSQNFQKIGENIGKFGKVTFWEVKVIVAKETPKRRVYNGLKIVQKLFGYIR